RPGPAAGHRTTRTRLLAPDNRNFSCRRAGFRLEMQYGRGRGLEALAEAGTPASRLPASPRDGGAAEHGGDDGVQEREPGRDAVAATDVVADVGEVRAEQQRAKHE